MHLGAAAPAGRAARVRAALERGPGAVVGAAGLAANSPYFFGKRLHAETRIELFSQATDTRPVELKNQGVRPRVFFGERWITSIFDLFEENVRYFPTLLAEITDEDPMAKLEAGVAPELAELRLHNGTVYRWNRPIYDIVGGTPHLRVENRVLPAGPTIADVLANAAFYYGAVRHLAAADRPVWTKMSFAACADNFERAAARSGMDARLYWPGFGEVSADELVLRHLLPMAHEGLRSWGVSDAVRERYLGIIEGRATTGVNGAEWQTRTVEHLEAQGHDRRDALRRMLAPLLRADGLQRAGAHLAAAVARPAHPSAPRFQVRTTGRSCSSSRTPTCAGSSSRCAASRGSWRSHVAASTRRRCPCATRATSPPSSSGRTRASTRAARAATSSTLSPGVAPGTTPSRNTVQAGRPSAPGSRGRQSLPAAVVPLEQVRVGRGVEPGEPGRAPGPREGRAECGDDVVAVQERGDGTGRVLTGGGERHVRATGVPPGGRPLGLAVAEQDEAAARGHARILVSPRVTGWRPRPADVGPGRERTEQAWCSPRRRPAGPASATAACR